MLIAEFTYRLPVILGCTLVILEVAVIIRLSNKSGNIAAALVISLLKRFKIKPRNNNIILNFFRKNTGIVNLLSPLEITVLVTLKEEHLLFARMSSCAHY